MNTEAQSNQLNSRYFYIDNLRIFLTALVILHHVAVGYGGNGGWPIKEAATDSISPILLTLFNGLNQSFFMSLFFFFAGFFTPPSLRKKGTMKFIRDKIVRLGVPILLYLFVILPFTVYLVANFVKGKPVTFFQVVKKQLIAFEFSPGHLWFLFALLVYIVLYLFIRKPISNLFKKCNVPSNKGLLILIAIMAVGTALVRIVYPLGTFWMSLQLGHHFHYLVFFFGGIIFYEKKWLDSLLQSNMHVWKITAFSIIISMPIMFVGSGALKTGPEVFLGGLHWQAAEYALWESIACVSISISLLVLFYKKFNKQNRLFKHLASNSYTVYIFHQTIVVLIMLPMFYLEIASITKFFIVATIAVPACYAVSHYIKKIKILKPVL